MKKFLAALTVCGFLLLAWSPAALANDRHHDRGRDRHNGHRQGHHQRYEHHQRHGQQHFYCDYHDCKHRHYEHSHHHNGEVIIQAHINDDIDIVWRVPID